jgi:hypothetical protein
LSFPPHAAQPARACPGDTKRSSLPAHNRAGCAQRGTFFAFDALLAVFFLTPWDSPEENATLGPPHGCPAEELDRRFAPRFEIIKTWEVPATYPGREKREQLRLLRKA